MKLVLTFSLFIGLIFSAWAGKLPKSCYGRYAGEMPSHMVVFNGTELKIAPHDIYITITREIIIYEGGNLSLKGLYSFFKQNKDEYLIKAKLSNGKTLSYELSFVWVKKERKIYLSPMNGQSEAILERVN